MPDSRTLNDLPHDIVLKVVGYIDKSDRSNVRKVSTYFKAIIDKLCPSYEEIKVTLRHGFISVKYDELCNEYKKNDIGCTTVINRSYSIVEGDYLTVFMDHFAAAIQNKDLDMKKLLIDAQPRSEEKSLDPIDFERFTRLMRTLKKPNNHQPLNIQVLHLIGMKLDVSCHIMSLAKPGLLNTIAIWSSYKTDNYESIYKKMVGMEQWRQAMALSFLGHEDSPAGDLAHAQQFQLGRSKMSPAEVMQLREVRVELVMCGSKFLSRFSEQLAVFSDILQFCADNMLFLLVISQFSANHRCEAACVPSPSRLVVAQPCLCSFSATTTLSLQRLLEHKTFHHCEIKFPPSYDYTKIKTALRGRHNNNDKWYFKIPNSHQCLEFSFINDPSSLRIRRINFILP
ncbi:hypothetical protein CAEBREN_06702 [Caenorhabditis brenneri]|uniref:F-box domain-containing protein n=1 Tax=Caenorhabditis brenneri TaxID=135651 RepID=G0PEI3_CAEBE|nr:hypothetical protein CAEBREN_06702 [Caenorhabditis brenneri]